MRELLRRPFRLSCLLALAQVLTLVAVGSAVAQGSAASVKVLQATVAADGTVRLLASVSDASGKPVRGLTDANFTVTAGERPVAAVRVSPTTPGDEPIALVLLIDVSGSMRAGGLAAAVQGASSIVSRLTARDYSALVAFGQGVRRVTDFGSEHQRVTEALATLRATDQVTHLYQAIFDAVELAASAPTKRAAVVCLTDGKDEGSAVGLEEVAAKAAVASIPVHALGYGPAAEPAALRRLAAASHGAHYLAPGPEDVLRAYGAIADSLQRDYLLVFSLPVVAAEPFRVAVTVDHRGDKASDSLTVTPAVPPRATPSPPAAPAEPPRRLFLLRPVTWLVLLAGLVAVAVSSLVLIRRRRAQGEELAATMVPPRVWFEVVKGADAGQKFLMLEKRATLGRDPRDCQILLRNDPMVGRRHAEIHEDSEGRYVLEDLGARNGTTVNGVRVTEPVVLQSDDRVVVGLSELLFIDQR